jgi:hypothetical protein
MLIPVVANLVLLFIAGCSESQVTRLNSEVSDPAKPQSSTWRIGTVYNLVDDPGEQNNLWGNHPELVKRLTELLETYKRSDY